MWGVSMPCEASEAMELLAFSMGGGNSSSLSEPNSSAIVYSPLDAFKGATISALQCDDIKVQNELELNGDAKGSTFDDGDWTRDVTKAIPTKDTILLRDASKECVNLSN